LATEWWNNQALRSASTPVTVNAHADTPNINATLAAGATMNGTVSDNLGVKLANVCVQAFDADGTASPTAVTTVTGFYRIGGLAGGNYKVHFQPDCIAVRGWQDQWNGGAPDR